MKKLLALLLALVMCLSLCACGSNNSTTDTAAESEPKSETDDQTSVEQAEITEYAIGDKFGTDSVECVVTETKWVSLEDVKSHPALRPVQNATYMTLDAEDMFPGYRFFGLAGLSTKGSGYPYFCVTFTLQNVGKTIVEPAIQGYDIKPYGNITVLYDDGYSFDAEEGFNTTLEVLGSEENEGRIFDLPDQIFENEDKPLKLKITLPNSSGETEEFIVSVR